MSANEDLATLSSTFRANFEEVTKAEKNKSVVLEMEQAKLSLQELIKELSASLDKYSGFRAANIGDEIEGSQFVRQRIAEAIKQLDKEENPRAAIEVLRNEAKRVAGQADGHYLRTWQRYVNSKFSENDRRLLFELNKQFKNASSKQLQTASANFTSAHSELRPLYDKVPAGSEVSDEVERVDAISKVFKKVQKAFLGDDPEVQAFVVAVSTTGVNYSDVSHTVRDWIEKSGLGSVYIITMAEN
ncbi:MAG: hypothetical protein O3A04_07810 [Actinomycetota bacterium]|nr:hypothetical protein [Actinomycetota bacterium]